MAALNALIQKRRRKNLAAAAWKAPCRVISIGNITSGGSGKTPFCIFLASHLQSKGIKVGVSHRGYKGRFEKVPTLISDGEKLLYGVRETGDEAFLLASRLQGIPVVAGKDRSAAVTLLLQSFPDLQVVILDDSFQHLRIARDLDCVCFDAETGIGNGRLIPAGYLREPLSALTPLQLAVVNVKHDSSDPSALEGLLATYTPHQIRCTYQPGACVDAEGKAVPASELAGKKALLVSGIANPDSFESTARQAGLDWLHHFRYPDHHAFSDPAELEKMVALAGKYQCEHIVCTEKDLAKLSLHPRISKFLWALRVDLLCQDAAQLDELLKQRLSL